MEIRVPCDADRQASRGAGNHNLPSFGDAVATPDSAGAITCPCPKRGRVLCSCCKVVANFRRRIVAQRSILGEALVR